MDRETLSDIISDAGYLPVESNGAFFVDVEASGLMSLISACCRTAYEVEGDGHPTHPTLGAFLDELSLARYISGSLFFGLDPQSY
jgi:hypothetical protein